MLTVHVTDTFDPAHRGSHFAGLLIQGEGMTAPALREQLAAIEKLAKASLAEATDPSKFMAESEDHKTLAEAKEAERKCGDRYASLKSELVAMDEDPLSAKPSRYATVKAELELESKRYALLKKRREDAERSADAAVKEWQRKAFSEFKAKTADALAKLDAELSPLAAKFDEVCLSEIILSIKDY